MAVDPGKRKRRKGAGAPPTEDAAGIEAAASPPPEPSTAPANTFTPPFLRPEYRARVIAEREAREAAEAVSSRAEPTPALKAPEPAAMPREREGSLAAEPEAEPGPARLAVTPAARGKRGEVVAPARRQRVPPPEAEPRVAFTTRVTLNTRERLEDACYHLRRKHQDFINEAIVAHLKKHGF